MTNISKAALVAVGVLSATVFGASNVMAFGGDDGQRFRDGNREGVVPTELREEWRAERKAELNNLTSEERQIHFEEMKEERKAHRGERKQAFEDFSGLTQDDIKAARQNGDSIGEILNAQGISEADTGVFLTGQANDRVDHIVEKRDLSDADEQTLRDRVTSFVSNILDRWFGSN